MRPYNISPTTWSDRLTPHRFFVGNLLLVAITLTLVGCSRSERRNQSGETPTTPVIENVTRYTPGDYLEDILVNGQTRQYRLHIPPKYTPDNPVPLVINLHGYNSSAEQQEQISQMSVKADQVGFIVVQPEGLGNPQSWHVGTRAEADADLQFIQDLLRRLQSQFNIDRARIYATGISNGAQMANRLGCEMADVFAALLPYRVVILPPKSVVLSLS